MESFSVRCIFEWNRQPNQKMQHLYEERITLWRASSIEAALQMAENEAIEYAMESGFTLVHLLQGYALPQTVNVTGVEVFSLLRESDLDPNSYLDAFFESGTERERQIT